MKKYLLSLMALVSLVVVSLLMADATINTRTDIWNFVNGIRINTNIVLTDTVGDAGTVLPKNAIGADELTGMRMDLVFCGQAAENGTIYLSPAAGVNGVDFADGVDYSISGTACDGLDGATEATQDLIVFPEVPFKVLGMYCQIAGTLGAAETAVFSFRSGAAELTAPVTCTISEAQRGCRALVGSTTDVVANAALSIKAVETSDNSDDDLWCQVAIMLR